MNESIFQGVSGLVAFIILFYGESSISATIKTNANIVDSNQAPHIVVSYLGQHCLPMSLLWAGHKLEDIGLFSVRSTFTSPKEHKSSIFMSGKATGENTIFQGFHE